MRLHKTTIQRHNVFNPKNTNLEDKILRLKKLLKGVGSFDELEITKDNIDGLLNNANRVRTLLLNKQKEKILVNDKKLKENVTTNNTPLVNDNEEIPHRKLLDIRRKYEDEIRVHGEQTSIKEGFVYIIVNPCYPEWIKAGMAFDYEKRLSVYNQYDPESKYSIIALRWTANRRLSEKLLLDILTNSSEVRKGEWFKIDKDISLKLFHSLKD